MAVITSITEVVEGRRAGTTFDGGPKSTYTRVFQVITSDTLTDLNQIKNLGNAEDPGGSGTFLPIMGSQYPTDAGTSVSAIEASSEDGYHKHFLTFTYTNPPPSGHGSNPPDLDWEFSQDVIEQQVIAQTDLGGHQQSAAPRTIKNSAGDVFDPPIMETEYFMVITLSKYFSTWSLSRAINERQGYINSEDFQLLGMTIPKHCLLCERYTTSGKQEIDGGTYYKLDAKFIYRPPFEVFSAEPDAVPVSVIIPGWNRAVIDLGFRSDEDGDGLRACVDPFNKTATDIPCLLDGTGKQKKKAFYDPYYFEFRTKRETDMKLWGLPTSLGNL